LSRFFSQCPPNCVVGDRLDDVELDQAVGQEVHAPDRAPLGRFAAGERYERGLALYIELARGTGTRTVVEGALESLAPRGLGKAVPDARHGRLADMQCRVHVGVEAILCRRKQDMGTGNGARRGVASTDQKQELSPLGRLELDAE